MVNSGVVTLHTQRLVKANIPTPTRWTRAVGTRAQRLSCCSERRRWILRLKCSQMSAKWNMYVISPSYFGLINSWVCQMWAICGVVLKPELQWKCERPKLFIAPPARACSHMFIPLTLSCPVSLAHFILLVRGEERCEEETGLWSTMLVYARPWYRRHF